MKEQGVASKLRCIGIGRSLYTFTLAVACRSVHTSRSVNQLASKRYSDGHTDDFEVTELEFEEAFDFHFIRTLDKVREF
jgi:hypothetical protein